MTKRVFSALILCSLVLCQSCMIGKKYKSPELNLPTAVSEFQTDSTSIADLKWWELYADTTLHKLIEKTLENNKDMLIAASRVEQLRQLHRIDKAAMLPSVGITPSASREWENYGGNNLDITDKLHATLQFQWEIDLWGNLRWANQKSIQEYLQSVEAQRALRMTLVANVATAYFELVALDNELAIVRQTLDTRAEGIRQTKIRFEGGLTSEIAYRQSQVEYAKTATLVPELERKIKAKENEIALLAGEYPHSIERSASIRNVTLPEILPAGLPSELLKRRPDVRAAEHKLIAANAAVGMAYTDRFPKLKITGNYGFEIENTLADFLKSPYGYIGGQLLTPIFSWGKLKARYKAQQQAYIQETENYKKTVLNVFHETSNAIVAYNKARDAYMMKQNLEDASRSYIDLARLQYINGVISYLDVLDAQRSYFDAQIGVSNAIRDQQIAIVQLYKALGGGWQQDETTQSDSDSNEDGQKSEKK